MSDDTTVYEGKTTYRNHRITVEIVGDGYGKDVEKLAATVKVWDGIPPRSSILNFSPDSTFHSDELHSFERDLPTANYEDEITEMFEEAKERIDAQEGIEYGARESVVIANERVFDTEGGDNR